MGAFSRFPLYLPPAKNRRKDAIAIGSASEADRITESRARMRLRLRLRTRFTVNSSPPYLQEGVGVVLSERKEKGTKSKERRARCKDEVETDS